MPGTTKTVGEIPGVEIKTAYTDDTIAEADPLKSVIKTGEATDAPEDVAALHQGASYGVTAEAGKQDPITTAKMPVAKVGDLTPTQAAQGTVSRVAEAETLTLSVEEQRQIANLSALQANQGKTDADGNLIRELTGAEKTELWNLQKKKEGIEARKVQTAERDAGQEAAAQAKVADYDMSTESMVDKVTGTTVTVAATPEAEKSQREAITGGPASGQAAEIINTAGYEASQRRTVTGTAATAAAASMIAETGALPPDISAAIVENPASVTAQIDDQPVEVQAAVAALPTEALVSSQIEGLLAGMDEGKTPVWARPAVAAINQQMAERGLSVSSVGRDALFNAIIQSALPIAQSNAQALQQRAAQNLSNEQQANLAQSTQDMQRRMANLANRQTSESQSAQMSQQMKVMQSQFKQEGVMLTAQQQQQTSLQNLQNRQQSAVLNVQNQQAMNAQNLGNEQQMAMANLQVEAERAGADQSAENQEKLAEFQVAADFLAKNAGFNSKWISQTFLAISK